ncbi:DMT family transporter [Bacillus benzoevorans]|nr:EamA family transporter [Bacillus benzoevorans]
MWLLAAIVTTFCFGINNSLFKWSTMKGMSKVNLQFYFYLLAFILTFIFGFFIMDNLHMNLLSLSLGALIGILNANGNIQMSKAYEKGPASITAPLIASNAVIPVLFAGILFHEQISGLQWSGIICMFIAAAVIQYSPSSKRETEYLPWLYRIILAIASFGLLGLLMKTSSYLHIDSITLLVSMYGGGTCYLAIFLLLRKEKATANEKLVGACIGLISIIGYSSYFFALKSGIASIIFPVVGLNCLIVVLVGCYFFKERLRIYQIAGIFAAVFGLVLTKI